MKQVAGWDREWGDRNGDNYMDEEKERTKRNMRMRRTRCCWLPWGKDGMKLKTLTTVETQQKNNVAGELNVWSEEK